MLTTSALLSTLAMLRLSSDVSRPFSEPARHLKAQLQPQDSLLLMSRCLRAELDLRANGRLLNTCVQSQMPASVRYRAQLGRVVGLGAVVQVSGLPNQRLGPEMSASALHEASCSSTRSNQATTPASPECCRVPVLPSSCKCSTLQYSSAIFHRLPSGLVNVTKTIL